MDRRESRSDRTERGGTGLYEIEESQLRVRDMPQRTRPREEMERLGVENVSDDVLLAVILRSGVKGVNVVNLAQGLLRHFGSLTELARASVDELRGFKGMGLVKAQTLKAALQVGLNLTQEALPERIRVKSPDDTVRLLMDKARTLDHEVFWSLHLDSRNYLKGPPMEVSRGLLDASLVHPREVFRGAIRGATAAIVLAHNHPSGDPTPSAEDVRITRQLVAAGKVIDIRVLDHVIVGRPANGRRGFVSMREEGVVTFG